MSLYSPNMFGKSSQISLKPREYNVASCAKNRYQIIRCGHGDAFSYIILSCSNVTNTYVGHRGLGTEFGKTTVHIDGFHVTSRDH